MECLIPIEKVTFQRPRSVRLSSLLPLDLVCCWKAYALESFHQQIREKLLQKACSTAKSTFFFEIFKTNEYWGKATFIAPQQEWERFWWQFLRCYVLNRVRYHANVSLRRNRLWRFHWRVGTDVQCICDLYCLNRKKLTAKVIRNHYKISRSPQSIVLPSAVALIH